ncbi:MAG: hypothetical protein ABW189_03645 [Rickettsiales bacterium]
MDKDFHVGRSRFFSSVPEGVNIAVIPRQERRIGADSRFVALNKPADSFHSPEIFSLTFDSVRKEEIRSLAGEASRNADMVCDYRLSHLLQPQIDTLALSVCDDTIALLSLDLAIESPLSDEDYAVLDGWTTHMIYYVLGSVYRDYVSPAVNGVNDYMQDIKTPLVKNPRDYVVYKDLALPRKAKKDEDLHQLHFLWVNRTFIISQTDEKRAATQRIVSACPRIETPGASVYLGWGNNVVEVENERECDLESVWQSMRLAQHCYAVMDAVSRNLTRYVGSAYDDKTNAELREVSRTLGEAMNEAAIFQVRYKDLRSELQGVPREIFKRLVTAWDFDDLYKSVAEKATICRANVEYLNHCINQRNSVRVQTALIVVACVGALSLTSGAGTESTLWRFGDFLMPDALLCAGVVIALALCFLVAATRPR